MPAASRTRLSPRLSPHFTLAEFTFSQTAARCGIDNTPTPEVLKNLRRLAALLEEVRGVLGDVPIRVSSGYRCPELNRAVKGARRSAHMQGLAVDFTAPGFGTVLQVARAVVRSGIVFDQIIHEYGSWVHLGLAEDGAVPRRQVLSIFRGTGYLAGLVSGAPAAAPAGMPRFASAPARAPAMRKVAVARRTKRG